MKFPVLWLSLVPFLLVRVEKCSPHFHSMARGLTSLTNPRILVLKRELANKAEITILSA